MKIKSVLIVGGGSSGWMTAAGLCKFFDGDDIKISLVESKTIPTVGVGESTIADKFNEFLSVLDLKDEDWMPHCNATYKNGLTFIDFRDVDTKFEYPFGNNQYGKGDLKPWSYLAAKYNLPPESFSEFHCENTFLCSYNRLTKNERNKVPYFDFKYDTAYQLDASKFGKYLKDNVAIPNGLNHYYDDIVEVKKDDAGFITSLVGKEGEYSADLYIDCTGFKSLLLGESMGAEYVSFKPWLSNDRALATHIPFIDKPNEMTITTDCTGMPNGWSWYIELWNHIGTGYVYSSDFVDDDTAEKEFREFLTKKSGKDRAEQAEFRSIRMKNGTHTKAWIKNVVGIGLSYGFIEPLESNGLLSAYSNILRIADLIKGRNYSVNRFDIDGYNVSAAHEMNGFMAFVAAHFGLSSRDDTPYWKYNTQERSYLYPTGYDKLGRINMSASYQSFGDYFEAAAYSQVNYQRWDPVMRGWLYIMAGMGYKPLSNYEYSNHPYPSADIKGWIEHRKRVVKYIETLQTPYEFLKENIYG